MTSGEPPGPLTGTSIGVVATAAPDYSRNIALRQALRCAGASLVAATHGSRFDAVLLGYPGHRHLPKSWVLARRRSVPLIFDPLVSLFDSRVGDRTEVSGRHPRAWVYWLADALGARLADLIFVESDDQRRFWSRLTRAPLDRFARTFTGTDEDVMRFTPGPPADSPLHPGAGVCHLVHYGNYFPLQGVDLLLAAVELLPDTVCRVTMVGDGPGRPAAEAFARERGLHNVKFVDAVPHPVLYRYVASADVVLGVFGASAKVERVIPNKVYDALAVGRPVVTADTPAARELIEPGRTALLVDRNPEAVARAIRRLVAQPEESVAVGRAGRRLFDERVAAEAQAPAVADALLRVLGDRRGAR